MSQSSYGHCHSQPRAETGVEAFLKERAEFDGRGVVIAIMDTGVDPAADGFQTTTTGQRKLIEVMDCSGAGDVDTSHVATAKDGAVTGLSGRTLKIPESWKCPSGKFHLGIVPIYELYPKSVRERLRKVRKERLWEAGQRENLVAAQRELQAHEEELGKEEEKLETREARLRREELSARVSILKDLEKNYDDTGPVADCIVFHDGEDWRGVVDASYAGRLAKSPPLRSFRDSGDFGKLNEDDLLTYTINIHRNGGLLEIVIPGTHGTHVAAMAAGHWPGEPERDGIAPGAQLVSLRIADQRLGGNMEVGAALTRALDRCVALGVDLINFSFGEATDVEDRGRIIEALEDTVWKRGILFVSSAGNNGPALSTGGAPGSTSSAVFGIGAWLSPEMMTGLYSLRESGLPSQLYPWSSRGPTADGALGTSVSAPGGAITSVPKWTLQCAQLMNGTSMSSPHVTGCLGLLLSGLKAKNLPSSPLILRTALENTAKPPPNADVFSTGSGLVRVQEAWAWLEKYGGWLSPGLTQMKVEVGERGHRGVYLREPHQLGRPRDILVQVSPVFRDDFDNEAKRAWAKQLRLRVLAEDGQPCPWVRAPENLELQHAKRAFTITVDPTALARGLHFASLEALDVSAPDAGPIFRLPITVVVPEEVTETKDGAWEVEWKDLCLSPGPTTTKRFFLNVPEGADWAHIKLKSLDGDKVSRYVVHLLQLMPDLAFRSSEHHKYILLSEKGSEETALRVEGGRTLEFCLAKWWTSLGESRLSASIAFHGIRPTTVPIALAHSRPIHKIQVRLGLGQEELAPTASLKFQHQPLRPTEATIRPLGERDKFQEERQIYELLLTYAFKSERAGAELTVSTGATDGALYESPLDSQLWQLFDANKRFIGAGEAFPNRNMVKVGKGEHSLLLQFRHDSEAVLERLKDQILTLRWKLEKPLSLDFYRSFNDAFAGREKLGKPLKLYGGSCTALYLALPPDDRLPKSLGPGHSLSGHLSLAADAHGKRVSLWPLSLNIAANPSNGKKARKEASAGAKKLEEQLRETKLTWLAKASATDGAPVTAQLIRDFPDHLPVYTTRLKRLADKSQPKHRGEILALAKAIQDRVELKDLLVYAGTKTDLNHSDPTGKEKAEMERKRTAMIEALAAKGSVLVDLYMEREKPDVAGLFKDQNIPSVPSTPLGKNSKDKSREEASEAELTAEEASVTTETPPELPLPDSISLADVEAIYTDLLRLSEAGDAKVATFAGKAAAARGDFARALKLFAKANEERPSKWTDALLLKLYERLGWTHVANFHRHASLLKHPPSFRPF